MTEFIPVLAGIVTVLFSIAFYLLLQENQGNQKK